MNTTAGRREWIALAVLALPTLLVSIDVFVLLLALPRLSTDLHAGSTAQLWIMDVYGFMVAGFLITMGTLGDRIGRRRLLLIGAAGFGAASVLAAYSTSAAMLIAARALLGVAGATLAPSTLGLIGNMFTDPRRRAVAISVWMACFMSGAALGPLVAGVMLDHFWWGSVFLLGVPAMVLLLVLGPVLLPEFRDAGAGRIDLPSVGLSLAAILPLVYGLKELARSGWHAVPAASVVAGAVFGWVFVRRQCRLEDPLLDVRLFARRAFGAALGSMMFGTMLMGAMMMFIAQYFQLVHGLTPLTAGLCMLPGVGGSLVSFLVSPHLTRWVRPAYLIGGGMGVSVCGLLLIAQAGAASGLAAVMLGFAITNLGAGPMVTLGTDLVIGSAPLERASSAGALNETSGEFGFALGIAALGSLGTAVYRARVSVPAGVPAGAARAAHDTLAGATTAAAHLPGRVGAGLLTSAREAFMSGMHMAATVSALLLVAVAVTVATLLRDVHPAGERETPEPSEAPTALEAEAAEVSAG
jgi:DHA2 family multidrug resistance protein-like MFS transporter